MSAPPVLLTRDGAVAVVTLNRPDKLNALSGAMRRALIAAFADVTDDADVRAIVLTGAGRAFCAGLDLAEIAASGDSVEANVANEDVSAAIAVCPKPTIGAINGLAVTGGFEIALALDMLLVGEEAAFIDSHVRVGITPGWGLSQRLARRIGVSRACEVSLSGRPLTASEAVAWGLANRMLPADALLPAAIALGRAIAEHDPAAVMAIKRLIVEGWHGTLAEGLAREAAEARDANLGVAADAVAAGFGRARAAQGAIAGG